MGKPANCHPDRVHHAKGLCVTCYHKSKGSEWVRHVVIKFKYALSSERYKSLLEKQNGLCAICKRPPEGKRLAVDHIHGTDIVRGLLCDNCNRGIGCFKDNMGLLEAAIEYLGETNASRNYTVSDNVSADASDSDATGFKDEPIYSS